MDAVRRNSGFTLFEVIIAVALVAIMAVAIAPPLIKNLNEGKVARAQSDAAVIAGSIMQFYKDTGTWPLQNDADAAFDLTRLAGNTSLGGGDTGIPAGLAGVAGSGNWDSWGQVGSLSDQLIRNATDTVDPLYPETTRPHEQPGWAGPYLDREPLDPWGHPYVVNIRYLNPNVAGAENHSVMVLSAGPNGVFETPFQDAATEEQYGGDDVGAVIRTAEPL
jgi:prepilin-type N-terminal cleavage/methylation domain-containing protein